MTKIKIYNNHYINDSIDYSQWHINQEEHRRIDIHFNNKCYSFVLDDKQPKVEVWSLKEERGSETLDTYLYSVSLDENKNLLNLINKLQEQ